MGERGLQLAGLLAVETAWTDVALALELEEVAIERITEQLAPWNPVDDPETYDEIDDDAIDEALWGMDHGVASAVLALSAAGCWVRDSAVASGGNGDRSAAVHFFPPIHRIGNVAEVLERLAEMSDCGLANSAEFDGGLEVYAGSPWDMLAFARALHDLFATTP